MSHRVKNRYNIPSYKERTLLLVIVDSYRLLITMQ